MTKIEQVAAALKAKMGDLLNAAPLPGPSGDPTDWSARPGEGHLDLNELARAAIEALREPSEEMVSWMHSGSLAFDNEAPGDTYENQIMAALDGPMDAASIRARLAARKKWRREFKALARFPVALTP